MSIRTKILLNFSVTSVLLIGCVFAFIYTLFAEYREEEFQKRQKEKITSTLSILSEIREIESNLVQAMDKIAINEFYDEKLLIFDAGKKLRYTSLDDVAIPYSQDILDKLSPEHPWIETKDGLYDVVGVYVENDNKGYYGISKAFDSFGYAKLRFLKYVMISTFLGISLIIILISYYLAERITRPIFDITSQLKGYSFENQSFQVNVDASNKEVALLAERFNELMKKMNEAFSFQKYAVHHISHELKTPIAVLVSNFERVEREEDPVIIRRMILEQKEGTRTLGEIINSLLEMAKMESGNPVSMTGIRVDELIYDLVGEVNSLYPDFLFQIEYGNGMESLEELNLSINGNLRLIRSALTNLLINSVQYNQEGTTKIIISENTRRLTVRFINKGITIPVHEQQFLFQHFYRGESSKGIRGFGLGLVFVQKIMALHQGTVTYQVSGEDTNIFTVMLPLS